MRKMQIENVLTSLSQLALLSAVLEAHNQDSRERSTSTNNRRIGTYFCELSLFTSTITDRFLDIDQLKTRDSHHAIDPS